MSVIAFFIGLAASAVGAICGIGGGVIIKPVLDLIGFASISAISFLSGCTVLAMSCYSALTSFVTRSCRLQAHTVIPLAIGASLGGVAGHRLFSAVQAASGNPGRVGAVQSLLLLGMTLGTLAYTLKKDGIRTRELKSASASAGAGFLLGVVSSFLGIGGGPINIVVLGYLFSMDTKTAASHSLFVILCSQITALLTALISRSVPAFDPRSLALMVAGGILGGILGRSLNRKMSGKDVDRLFVLLMLVIAAVCVLNFFRYSM